MTQAIRPYQRDGAPAPADQNAERVRIRSRARLLNARIDALIARCATLPPARTMTPGEKALNTAAAAFPDKLLVMHQNSDGEFVRLDVVEAGTVIASVASGAYREDAAQDAK